MYYERARLLSLFSYRMKITALRFVFLLIATSIALVACRKEHFKPTWQTQWLAPLFNTDLSLDQIIGDSLLTAGPNGAIQLVYNNTVYQFDPNADAISIPDTSVRTSYSVNALTLSDQ